MLGAVGALRQCCRKGCRVVSSVANGEGVLSPDCGQHVRRPGRVLRDGLLRGLRHGLHPQPAADGVRRGVGGGAQLRALRVRRQRRRRRGRPRGARAALPRGAAVAGLGAAALRGLRHVLLRGRVRGPRVPLRQGAVAEPRRRAHPAGRAARARRRALRRLRRQQRRRRGRGAAARRALPRGPLRRGAADAGPVAGVPTCTPPEPR